MLSPLPLSSSDSLAEEEPNKHILKLTVSFAATISHRKRNERGDWIPLPTCRDTPVPPQSVLPGSLGREVGPRQGWLRLLTIAC